MKVWKVSPKNDKSWLIVRKLSELEWMEQDAEKGSAFTIECIEMTEEELNDLPEFEGF